MPAASEKYKWDPNGYASHSDSQKEWAVELLGKLELKGDEHVLDIGCGDGKVTKLISERVPDGRVVGIDSSKDMIEFASSRFPGSKYNNLKFVNMDANQIEFEESFDVVFSNAALHWIKDHRPVLKGIYRALRPKGKAVVQMGGKGNANSVVEILHEMMEHDEWKEYFKDFSFPYGFYTPEEYEKWLIGAGFKVIRMELIEKHRIHNSMDEFKGWISTQWLPYTSRIPESQREKYMDMVAYEFHRRHSCKDDKIVVAMQRLEYEAIKNQVRPTSRSA